MSEYPYIDAELASCSRWILPVITAELKNLPPGTIVADVGCGNGSMLAQFRQYGFELHGLEMSTSGLAQAEKAYPGIEFSYADLTTDLSAHPLAGKCGVVISTEVVEHIFLPRVFSRNCYALLRPRGRLILSTPYHGYLKNMALALTGKLETHFTALWDYGHIKFWSKYTLTALLEESGFEVCRFQGAGRIPFLWKSMILVAEKPGRSRANGDRDRQVSS